MQCRQTLASFASQQTISTISDWDVSPKSASHHFSDMQDNEFKLEPPMFYLNPVGIRFEIGPPEIDVLHEYVNTAIERAYKIFTHVFGKTHSCRLTLQEYSYGRQKIRINNPVLKTCRNSIVGDISYSKRRDIFRDNLTRKREHWNHATVELKIDSLDIKSLLKQIVLSDYGNGYSGNCYFSNLSGDIVYHLYDDRGLDVVANKTDYLSTLYKDFNELILSYDRNKIDETFKDEK